ncbi:hypothetical protein BCR34DRAFT_626446 [Clohesyomyces aquaticus]|uniref:Short chain dehydrogenase n=1 Tax=Clohesyomyces aquaticus TaxID=1231657 RepID=A0A1Y1ZAT3_9PLEO|nr:hypothetical protein BCR34DRAFT_626446 [Clohesyomyces aquaticus]
MKSIIGKIAKINAAQGAHVTGFAQRQRVLNAAREEIMDVRISSDQEILAISLDLADAVKVNAVFRAQPRIADVLYCSAGGCRTECGFITDIQASDLKSCMRNNYFTAAYTAQAILKIWSEDYKKMEQPKHQKLRQIVFINSGLACIPVPGYGAYTVTSKSAIRGFADTLHIEALRLSNLASKCTSHCAFPSNFISEAFVPEQEHVPQLTKEIEGTTGPIDELIKNFSSGEKVARQIIVQDSWESSLIWANMVEPSPKRGWGISDSFFAIIVGLFVWPILRRRFDGMARADGRK